MSAPPRHRRERAAAKCRRTQEEKKQSCCASPVDLERKPAWCRRRPGARPEVVSIYRRGSNLVIIEHAEIAHLFAAHRLQKAAAKGAFVLRRTHKICLLSSTHRTSTRREKRWWQQKWRASERARPTVAAQRPKGEAFEEKCAAIKPEEEEEERAQRHRQHHIGQGARAAHRECLPPLLLSDHRRSPGMSKFAPRLLSRLTTEVRRPAGLVHAAPSSWRASCAPCRPEGRQMKSKQAKTAAQVPIISGCVDGAGRRRAARI